MPGPKDWIIKASGDLRAARKLIKDDDYTLDMAAYATQQVAEKALKAFLMHKQKPLFKTHDLIKLLEACVESDTTFEALREYAFNLNPYAIQTRYPDDRFEIDRNEVIEAINFAEKILKFVRVKIEPEDKKPQLNLFD